jgi:hypothetical protein
MSDMSANQMLDAVVASLQMYPHGGGDIRVMAEVDRIVDRIVAEKTNALEAALYISRESERFAKDRLSAVSEELVAAHREIDKLEYEIAALEAEEGV